MELDEEDGQRVVNASGTDYKKAHMTMSQVWASCHTDINSCSVSKGKKSEQFQVPAAAFPSSVHARVTLVRGRKVICVDPPPRSSIPTLLF